jgi:hypothetical protein
MSGSCWDARPDRPTYPSPVDLVILDHVVQFSSIVCPSTSDNLKTADRAHPGQTPSVTAVNSFTDRYYRIPIRIRPLNPPIPSCCSSVLTCLRIQLETSGQFLLFQCSILIAIAQLPVVHSSSHANLRLSKPIEGSSDIDQRVAPRLSRQFDPGWMSPHPTPLAASRGPDTRETKHSPLRPPCLRSTIPGHHESLSEGNATTREDCLQSPEHRRLRYCNQPNLPSSTPPSLWRRYAEQHCVLIFSCVLAICGLAFRPSVTCKPHGRTCSRDAGGFYLASHPLAHWWDAAAVSRQAVASQNSELPCHR